MTERRNSSRAWLVSVVVGLIAAVAVGVRTRNRAPADVRDLPGRIAQDQEETVPRPVTEPPAPASASTRRWETAFLMAANAGAITAAVLTSDDALAIAGPLALVALLISAVALRGRTRHTSLVIAVYGGIGVFAVYLLSARIAGSTDAGDVATVLLQTFLGIAAVGGLAWLASTWQIGRFVEPTALVVVAVILTWLSLHGIGSLTAPIDLRHTHPGRAALFVSDPDVALRWVIEADSDFQRIDMGIFTSDFPMPEDFRWAVVLMATAQLADIHPDAIVQTPDDLINERFDVDLSDEEVEASEPELRVVELPPDRLNDPTDYGMPEGSAIQQIVSGGLNARGEGMFGGRPVVPLAVRAASRTAVMMPGYGRMDPRDLSARQRDEIAAALGGQPMKPSTMSVTVDAGYAGPFRTVQSAYPPLADPGRLVWGTDDVWNPFAFVLFDQQVEDRARNQLFMIAILLGTAASCLVAALQSALRPSGRTRPR